MSAMLVSVLYGDYDWLAGPKRSTLQAMLANLESEDDMPALQSGAASPPRGGNNNIQELEQTGTTYTLLDVTVVIYGIYVS